MRDVSGFIVSDGTFHEDVTTTGVVGFLSIDGVFFEDRSLCEHHEAKVELIRKLDQLRVNSTKVVAIVEELWYEIERYINAYKATVPDTPTEQLGGEADEQSPRVDERVGDHILAAETAPSFLKLPSRGLVNVPHLGSGPRSEEISDRRPVDGVGGGESDAPDVRSRPAVATQRSPKTSGSRAVRGRQNPRQDEVD